MKWRADPVMTNVKTTGLPIDKLEFPAITICGLGMIEATLDRAYAYQIDQFFTRKNRTVTWPDDYSNDTREAAEELLRSEGLYQDFIDELYPGKAKNKVPL